MKKLRIVIVGCFLLYVASPAFSAQWSDKSDRSIPDDENIKSAESFIAQLILTTDEQGLLKKWNKPSETVYVNTSSIVERNSPISAFIVFGGCKVDQQGNCDLVTKFKIYQPDGKLYADLPEMEVWSGKPAPPNRSIQLSVAYLKVVVENGEQLGKYKFESVVTDKVGKESVKLLGVFEATEEK